ncbi:MAG: chitinase [Actinomycetota bacterium]
MRLRSAAAPLLLAAALCVAGVPLTALSTAGAAPAAHAAAAGAAARPDRAKPLPAQVYAPYFEGWRAVSIPSVAHRSGVRYFSLAALQTARRGSCTLTWNGDPGQPVRPGGRFTAQLAALRAMGGDVLITLGGSTAGLTGTEIADSCSSVAKIAKAYENVITSYHVTRLDMDVEERALNDPAGLARRSEAIAQLEQWAKQTHRHVEVELTLGAVPWGLPPSSRRVVASAVAHHAAITVVNAMTFDYFTTNARVHMGAAAISALRAMHRQLAKLYPGLSSRQRWLMEGVTLMPGLDDNPHKNEVTYPADARQVAAFARAHQLPLVSIWAIQRDNGRCPGHKGGDNSCSSIRQPTWEFSHILAR